MDTFVETKTVVKTVINGNGPDYTIMSVVPYADVTGVELVVGADYDDACAHMFTKKGLAKLIEILQDIHDAIKYGESA